MNTLILLHEDGGEQWRPDRYGYLGSGSHATPELTPDSGGMSAGMEAREGGLVEHQGLSSPCPAKGQLKQYWQSLGVGMGDLVEHHGLSLPVKGR